MTVRFDRLRNEQLEVYDTFLRDARFEDRREWETASGVSFEEALLDTILSHSPMWVARVNGVPAMLFGVNPHNQPLGTAWMIATGLATKNQHALHRHHRESLGEMLKVRPLLHAWADSRNGVHLRWMEWAGWQPTGAIQRLGEEPAVPFALYLYHKEMYAECASQARRSP